MTKLTRHHLQAFRNCVEGDIVNLAQVEMDALCDGALALLEENEKLRKALEQYANHSNWYGEDEKGNFVASHAAAPGESLIWDAPGEGEGWDIAEKALK